MPKRKNKIQDHFPYNDSYIIGLDEISVVINYIQLSRKRCSFVVNSDDALTIEHILSDCEINFEKIHNNRGIKYHVEPPPSFVVSEEVFVIYDEYDDEITEDGQCF